MFAALLSSLTRCPAHYHWFTLASAERTPAAPHLDGGGHRWEAKGRPQSATIPDPLLALTRVTIPRDRNQLKLHTDKKYYMPQAQTHPTQCELLDLPDISGSLRRPPLMPIAESGGSRDTALLALRRVALRCGLPCGALRCGTPLFCSLVGVRSREG